MRPLNLLSLAGASLLVLAGAANAAAPAASPPGPVAAAPAEETTLGEIVITARRRTERLQDVPQTVNAVTADTLQKLNIRQFQEIQNVVPGLALAPSTTGTQNSAALRGVSFDVNSGSQPTVAFYLNDAPVALGAVFQSLFDIGQVEVLKGPQGTTRGVSAPSGAITITTRKPDLAEFGGYFDVTATDLGGRDAQGAINLPIIKDVLALRLAGVVDTNNAGGVRSIHNDIRPRGQTTALRASLSFEPNDQLKANVTYQHLDNDLTTFSAVSGPGPGAFLAGNTLFPASVNPPIAPDDRAAVQDWADNSKNRYDVVTAQVDARILGQHVSYVGSYSSSANHNRSEGGAPAGGDVGNILPGIPLPGNVHTNSLATTQEIRLASDPSPDRFFDYTVGGFYSWNDTDGRIVHTGPLLPGAFGSAPGINYGAFNSAYQIPVIIEIPGTTQETSLFGSMTLHLGPKTELSGGIRHIWSIVDNQTTISTGNGLINLGALGLPASFPCSAIRATAGANPGDCLLNTAAIQSNFTSRNSADPNIYNVSLSHHFTRDFLVYADTGTAFRPAVASVGLQGAIANSPLPGVDTLSFHPPEHSRAYELGFKSTWLDGRARLNASIFRQKFHNLTVLTPGILYLNTLSTPPAPATFDITQSVDALVTGFDVDTALQITPSWNASAQLSYADGKIQNSLMPCNITGANGQPVFNTGGLISLCPGGSSSRLPLWSLTVQSEYTHPVTDDLDGFVRGLMNYYPQNKNRAEPNFTVNSYSLVNLYAGIRSHDGAWEASIFARNAFKTERTLDISGAQASLNAPLAQYFPSLIHPSGYFQTTMTAQREVGVNVHYAWGSR